MNILKLIIRIVWIGITALAFSPVLVIGVLVTWAMGDEKFIDIWCDSIDYLFEEVWGLK
jgi:hypothetical protein